MRSAQVMFDHPAWQIAEDGTAWRAVRLRDQVLAVVVRTSADGVSIDAVPEVSRLFRLVDPGGLVGEAALVDPLQAAGAVLRLANPDLWDALATGIVRQVIRAGQARLLYRDFCRAHGENVETPAGPAWLFPSPDAVLALPDTEFTRLGMSFKRAPLRAAAEAYLARHSDWASLPAAELVAAVQEVPRIGPWTAGAAVADATNDFSLYPFADLAVRTWARRLAPAYQWPQSEPEFAVVWRGLAGEQLCEWTLLTLAWGVRHAQAQGAAAL
ncbi:hypothetical protein [Actinokineospora sp. NPDC004072]